MIIQAPHPNYNTVITLPDPLLTNQERYLEQREYKIAMDKTVQSYVKRNPGKVYAYELRLTREKGFELLEFINNYNADKWKVVDHHGVTIIGYLLTNPNETTIEGRLSEVCGSLGYGPDERLSFTLEIET